MDLPTFQHLETPLRLYSGANSLAQLGRELDRVGARRALVFCGGTLSRDARLMGLLHEALGARCAGVFAGVRAHSPVTDVEAGAAELRRVAADAAIAVGGGSAIVTARAASILLAEGRDARSLATARDASGKLHSPKLLAPKMPQLVVPTTPTTAMVKAGSAVFDTAASERLALFDPKTRAQAIFIHPDFIASAPRSLLLGASLNTLTLAVEGQVARTGDPLADAKFMHALRLLARHLANPASHDDALVRGELMLAAVLCGQGTDHTGAGMMTVLGHAVGTRHHVDNGICNAIVMPHVMRFNAAATPAGMAKIACALGVGARLNDAAQTLEAVIAEVTRWFAGLGIAPRLRDVGVPRAGLAEIAVHAMDDWFLAGNPRPVRAPAEVEEVLQAAW